MKVFLKVKLIEHLIEIVVFVDSLDLLRGLFYFRFLDLFLRLCFFKSYIGVDFFDNLVQGFIFNLFGLSFFRLSFFGLSSPEVVTWGRMLASGQRFLFNAWWLSFFPGTAIFLTVLAFNLLGDAIGVALNPRAPV